LYLGSAILAGAFAAACRSWPAAVLVAVYFGVFYIAVMRREERELRKQYGAAFEAYAARVPLFFPVFPKTAEPAASVRNFSWQQYARNREYQAAIGLVLVLAVLYLLRYWQAR
jgi:protein-S-isoprenylcysteine O-methyltransferase Ste14